MIKQALIGAFLGLASFLWAGVSYALYLFPFNVADIIVKRNGMDITILTTAALTFLTILVVFTLGLSLKPLLRNG